MPDYHIADYITIALAREIADGERVFHGVASPMPVVAIQIAKQLHAKNLVYLSIAGGVNTTPAAYSKVSTADNRLREGSETDFSLADIFDLSARGALDVAFLSGAQIDAKGSLNLSAIGSFDEPKVRLPGGAGSAALLPTVKRGILWKTNHDTRSLVETLDVTTASGNTEIVVTPKCVFKRSEDGLLRVYYIFPTSSWEDVVENTGFKVEKHAEFKDFAPISEDELNLLDELDPEGLRYSEFN